MAERAFLEGLVVGSTPSCPMRRIRFEFYCRIVMEITIELFNFGQLFKLLRIRQRKTLRQLCLENGFEPSRVSKIERGFLSPSEDELIEYAKALNIVPGTDDWLEFFDLAAEIKPKNVLNDTELIEKLPVITHHKMDNDDLNVLIEKIRQA